MIHRDMTMICELREKREIRDKKDITCTKRREESAYGIQRRGEGEIKI